MQRITNWPSVSRVSKERAIPIVLMVDQDDCPFCVLVEQDFINPMLKNETLKSSAIYGKISLDYGERIGMSAGKEIPTRKFLEPYGANLTPTILFLDPEGEPLTENLVGIATPDFYGYYLEKAIEESLVTLKRRLGQTEDSQ